ncbi:chorismate mutase [Mycolicibacterium sp. CBM1]
MSTALAFGAATTLGVLAIALAGPAAAEPADPLHDLVDAAAQRLQTADPVAANKWLTGGPITDPARVQQVLATVAKDAESNGVSGDYVTDVFTDQIDATEGIQYSRFAGWKFDPATAPTSAPELASSRSVIDGLNHTMVTQIALQWPVLHSPGCLDALGTAKTGVATARQFDDLYRAALDVATRSYCGA